MAQQITKTVSVRFPIEDYDRIAELAGHRGLTQFCRNATVTMARQLETVLGSNEQCKN